MHKNKYITGALQTDRCNAVTAILLGYLAILLAILSEYLPIPTGYLAILTGFIVHHSGWIPETISNYVVRKCVIRPSLLPLRSGISYSIIRVISSCRVTPIMLCTLARRQVPVECKSAQLLRGISFVFIRIADELILVAP